MSDPFLVRWSRLKRRSEPLADTPTEPRPAEQSSARVPEPSAPRIEGATEAERPAAPELPTLDEITEETDITVFLRLEVPAAARNAALRKVWLLDPAIRNFIGPARDYDYDWNIPGGVPGGGPIESGETASKLVEALLGPAHDPPPLLPRDAVDPDATSDLDPDGVASGPTEEA